MENEKEKLNFFSRVKLAVVKLEDYNIFLNEKLSIGIKYFFLIVLIFAFLLSTIETYDFSKKMSRGYEYIKNELPSFNYSNGNLEFSENVNAYDNNLKFSLICDTSDTDNSKNIAEFTNKIENQGVIFLKDKAILVNNGNHIILDYLSIQEQYGITELNNQILLEKIDSIGIRQIIVMYAVIILLGVFIFEVIALFVDCILLSIFAYFTAKITKTDLNYKQSFNISIYSLTLPIIFYMIYCMANYFSGFYTQYFKTIYLLIAYVYVVAVILIIKSDLMKQKAEIGRIIEIKKENNEEETDIEEKNENKKPDKKKDDKETKEEKDEGDIVEGEPDGSEI